MAKVVSSYSNVDVNTVTLRIGIASEGVKRFLSSISSEETDNLYRGIGNKIEDMFREQAYIILQEFSIKDLYIDYGSIYVTYEYSILVKCKDSVENMIPKEMALVDTIVAGCIRKTLSEF